LAPLIKTDGTAPQPDELEVAIFGPGIGEAILVHVGYGVWIAVDSARHGGQAWALWYLKEIGAAANGVGLILASHWHGDHIAGLSDLIAECPNAAVAFSNALQTKEFRNLLAVFTAAANGSPRSKVDEMTRAWRIIRQRLDEARAPVTMAGSNTTLMDRFVSDGIRARAVALSPSALDTIDARTSFDELSAIGANRRPKPLLATTPNHASVVIYVEIAGHSFLLAADREIRNHPGRGWEVIVANRLVAQVPASVLKVAHHGSPNGFYAGLWPQWIDVPSIGVVTPFARSRLPDVATLRQYLAQGVDLYATAWPHSTAKWRVNLPPKTKLGRPRKIEPGFVRLRRPIVGGQWTVKLFGGAMAVDANLLSTAV
jgi:hypothetical protein